MNLKKTVKISLVVFALFSIAGIAHASFLEEQAGISASITLPSLNLAAIEGVYKNIESSGADFLIGSVAVDGYPEDYDVHVYANSNGNVIAYYLRTEPAAKIINWIAYSGTLTLQGSILELALLRICQEVGQALPAVTYYDFRHPNATHFKVISDEAIGSTDDTFRYLIPSNIILRAASWTFASRRVSGTQTSLQRMRINGSTITSYYQDHVWNFRSGDVGEQFSTRDVYHEVEVYSSGSTTNAYGAVFFIYSE